MRAEGLYLYERDDSSFGTKVMKPSTNKQTNKHGFKFLTTALELLGYMQGCDYVDHGRLIGENESIFDRPEACVITFLVIFSNSKDFYTKGILK